MTKPTTISRSITWAIAALMLFNVARISAMDLSSFQSALAQLKREHAANPGSPAVRELLQELDRTHNPSRWISEVPSRDMASPSPERLDRIRQIGDAIAPYEQVLVDLAVNKTLGSDADRAVDFLWYAKPTPTLKRSLLNASDEHPIAFKVLFETGMFDGEARAKYATGLAPSAPPELREQRASMASDWGLPEALPIYAEMLRKPFDPTKVSFVGHIPAEDAGSSLSSYGLAAQGAMHLGASGKALLPLIKQRFAEIQAAFPDKHQALTGNLNAAIDVLEGRRPPPVHAAINGRGAINLTVGSTPVAQTVASPPTVTPAPSPATPVPSAAPPTAPTPVTPIAQTPAPTVEHKSPMWPWLVGIVALIVIVTVALKRRA